MLKFKVSLQNSAIAKADESGVITRTNVYYPQLVDLHKKDSYGLVESIMNNGSSAFTKGEWLGVVSDLGTSIADQLVNGFKVDIYGLGTFEPTLKTSQSNVKDPSKVNSSNFVCGAKFTPDARFIQILSGATWQRENTAAKSSEGSMAYSFTFRKQDNSNNLALTCSKAEIINAVSASAITVTVNGASVGTIAKGEGEIYLNGAIESGETLSNATVVINMPEVTIGAGEAAVTYPAQKFTLKGISQTGGPVSGAMD